MLFVALATINQGISMHLMPLKLQRLFDFDSPRAATALALALSATALFAQDKASTPMQIIDPEVAAALQQTIQTFAQASDRRETAALEAILHPAFRVVFTTKPGTPPTTLDRAQYLQMMRDGKIGGADRKVSVSTLSVAGDFAASTALMVRPDASFQGVYSLIEQGGRWLLLQEAVQMTAHGSSK
jgi:Putative lumazine-binding